MTHVIVYKGVEYKVGSFHHLINGRATEWELRVLRLCSDTDLKTRIEELNYEMYKLILKDQRETRNK